MSYSFIGCSCLKSFPDISKWNTKNVSDMSHLFEDCFSLTSFPNISKWVFNKKLKKKQKSKFEGVNKKIIRKKVKGCLIY